jgi:hypothetical protein
MICFAKTFARFLAHQDDGENFVAHKVVFTTDIKDADMYAKISVIKNNLIFFLILIFLF